MLECGKVVQGFYVRFKACGTDDDAKHEDAGSCIVSQSAFRAIVVCAATQEFWEHR